MISEWRLSNFKSIRKETRLQLAPLTVLAGANSSGKSSVLQSLLLISQSLTSQVDQRAVLLNGPLVRLGNFDDIRSFQGDDTINVGWTIQGQATGSGRPAQATPLVEASCDISFGIESACESSPIGQLNPRLASASLRARNTGDSSAKDSAIFIRRLDPMSPVRADQIQTAQNPWGSQDGFSYDVNLDVQSRSATLGPLQYNDVLGCYTRHFIPQGLFVYVNIVDYFTSLYSDIEEFSGYAPNIFENVDFLFVETLREQLTQQERNALHFDDPFVGLGSASNIYLWRGALQRAIISKRPGVDEALQRLKLTANKYFASFSTPYAVLYQALVGPLATAADYMLNRLSASIRYLGPLRDEPRHLQPLANTAEQKNVGLRGEQSAAVFNLFKDLPISYVPAASLLAIDGQARAVDATLGEAVLDWLRSMGLVQELQVADHGKDGHELQLTTEGVRTLHDLTHVGVGVSQVFPIVLMALLADADTTLIFEQPELHLHPRVQAQLADFFLSVALSGRQCIVETHSEYLINRLRYRAAISKDRATLDATKIYFAEKRDGVSYFREVSINEFGAINDWPDGFFDQSQLEAESILRAAINKRRTFPKAMDG